MERDLSAFVMPEGWFAPFYYRQVNELFDDRFSGNGYYSNDDDDTTDGYLRLKRLTICCGVNGEFIHDRHYWTRSI